MEEQKPVLPEGELRNALAAMPAIMAALMRDYVEKKDVNARIEVRLRMKALLDFAGADTEYPPNALVDGTPGPVPPVRDTLIADPQPGVFGNAGGVFQQPMVIQTPAVAAVPAPRRIGVDNSDLLH